MANNKGKKKKIKISKKLLNKIEIGIIIFIILAGLVIYINTRTLYSEDATKLVYEKYIEVENVLSKVLTGTDWLELSEECIEQEGYKFCKSESKDLLEYDDLKKYINSVCTKDFTKSILEEKEIVYKNIDDKLYVLATNRNTDVFYAGLKEVKPVSISSNEIKCKAICNYYIDLESQELYTMSYDFIINKSLGSWKASFFELPY